MNFIEKYEEGLHTFSFFSADFNQKNIILNNTEYPLGYVSQSVANIPKDEMDKLLRWGAVIMDYHRFVNTLGYHRKEFIDFYRKLQEMFCFLKSFQIFSFFDFEMSMQLIDKIFKEENLDCYEELIKIKHKLYRRIPMKLSEEEKLRFSKIDEMFQLTRRIGSVYSYLAVDTANFGTVIQNFVVKIMDSNSRQKEQLAKSAFEFFNDKLMMAFIQESNPASEVMDGFSVSSRQWIVPVVKENNGDFCILRRIYFRRLMDLYVTDLFESLSAGHYLWQCKVCGKYFLMQNAHQQLYCSEVNKKYGVPCSHIAKHPEITDVKMKKQKKSDSPYYLLWKKRNDSIRKNKSLGKYDENISAKAKALIDAYFDRTSYDFEYARNDYVKDMELSRIYEEVMKN